MLINDIKKLFAIFVENKIMQNNIQITENDAKDYYDLNINGVVLGAWERSDLRHLIQEIDNII